MSLTPTTQASNADDGAAINLDELRLQRSAAVSRDVLLFLIAFRILNALSIKTFFQPDEYFQSLEPAWQMAFGADSGAWITWVSLSPLPEHARPTIDEAPQEWKNNLRSSIHPAIFAGVYWLSSSLSSASNLSPDSHAELMIAVPKMVQAVFAALGDYYTWRLGQKIYGRESKEAWAAVCSIHSNSSRSPKKKPISIKKTSPLIGLALLVGLLARFDCL